MILAWKTDVVAIEWIDNANFRVLISWKITQLLQYKNDSEIRSFRISSNFWNLNIENTTEEISTWKEKFWTGYTLVFRDADNKLILKIRLIQRTNWMFLLGDILEPKWVWMVQESVTGSLREIFWIEWLERNILDDITSRYTTIWEIIHERKYTETI